MSQKIQQQSIDFGVYTLDIWTIYKDEEENKGDIGQKFG